MNPFHLQVTSVHSHCVTGIWNLKNNDVKSDGLGWHLFFLVAVWEGHCRVWWCCTTKPGHTSHNRTTAIELVHSNVDRHLSWWPLEKERAIPPDTQYYTRLMCSERVDIQKFEFWGRSRNSDWKEQQKIWWMCNLFPNLEHSKLSLVSLFISSVFGSNGCQPVNRAPLL